MHKRQLLIEIKKAGKSMLLSGLCLGMAHEAVLAAATPATDESGSGGASEQAEPWYRKPAPWGPRAPQPGWTFPMRGGADVVFTELTGAGNPVDLVDVDGRSAPAFVDIDNDGDNDLFVGTGNSLFGGYGDVAYFENTGTDTTPAFVERTGTDNPLDLVDVAINSGRAAPALVDIDNDGDMDAFIGAGDGRVRYFENTGSAASAAFVERLGSDNPLRITVDNYAMPTFVDIDNDGDSDAFVGNGNDGFYGGRVFFFENTGTASAPVFVERTGTDNPLDSAFNIGERLSPAFVDCDSDGDFDVFIGEFFSFSTNTSSIFYFENTGDVANPAFIQRTGTDNPLDVAESGSVFDRTPTFVDIDGDGDDDAFIGEGDVGKVQYFRNDTPLVRSVTIDGDAGWRMLSAPKTGFVLNDIADDTAIQGITGSPSPTADANALFYPDTGLWTEPTDMSTPFGDGQGFIVYFFDNNVNGSSPLPLDLSTTGLEPTSDVTVPLELGGFTLVGNPFATNLNLDDLSGNGAGVVNGGLGPIQVWDDGAGAPGGGDPGPSTGSYVVFNFGAGEVVSMWQGFFLESDDATQVTIPVSARTNDAASIAQFAKGGATWRSIQLELEGPDGNLDRAVQLFFHPDAETGHDGFDATKLTPFLGQYATLAFRQEREEETAFLAQDAREANPSDTQGYSLEFINEGLSGTFTLRWPTWKNVPEDWEVLLTDLTTGAVVDMRAADNYSFDDVSEAGKDKAERFGSPEAAFLTAVGTPRFRIEIRPGIVTGIEEAGSLEVPQRLMLEQNYPNPFNPATSIRYGVPEAGTVHLAVYDVLGRELATLASGRQAAGWHTATWDAKDYPSGVYVYRLVVNGQVETRTMLLVK